MWKIYYSLLALSVCASGSVTFTDSVKTPDNFPVPYLSWSDVRALYPPNRYPGDWDCPKATDIKNKGALIERCKQDLAVSLKADPDPFRLHHKLPPGELVLDSINKDPENRIIYFVFSYESELIDDLFVVYYYDPTQDRFILKSTR